MKRRIMYYCSICDFSGLTEEAFHKHKCEDYGLCPNCKNPRCYSFSEKLCKLLEETDMQDFVKAARKAIKERK